MKKTKKTDMTENNKNKTPSSNNPNNYLGEFGAIISILISAFPSLSYLLNNTPGKYGALYDDLTMRTSTVSPKIYIFTAIFLIVAIAIYPILRKIENKPVQGQKSKLNLKHFFAIYGIFTLFVIIDITGAMPYLKEQPARMAVLYSLIILSATCLLPFTKIIRVITLVMFFTYLIIALDIFFIDQPIPCTLTVHTNMEGLNVIEEKQLGKVIGNHVVVKNSSGELRSIPLSSITQIDIKEKTKKTLNQ